MIWEKVGNDKIRGFIPKTEIENGSYLYYLLGLAMVESYVLKYNINENAKYGIWKGVLFELEFFNKEFRDKAYNIFREWLRS